MTATAASLDPGNPGLSALERSEAELNQAIEELKSVPKLAAGLGGKSALRVADSALKNVPVELQIVIGGCEMTVAELAQLGEGSTVSLNRRIGDPADAVINGVCIARGEIIAMPEDPSRFGFTIIEVLT